MTQEEYDAIIGGLAKKHGAELVELISALECTRVHVELAMQYSPILDSRIKENLSTALGMAVFGIKTHGYSEAAIHACANDFNKAQMTMRILSLVPN